jgi:hypothetical protein
MFFMTSSGVVANPKGVAMGAIRASNAAEEERGAGIAYRRWLSA